MSKKILLILLIISLLTTSACWDRREPETLAIVIAAGFDYNPETDMYKVILQIVSHLTTQGIQADGGDNKPDYWTVSAWGYTIFDAISNIRKKISHQIHYSHIQLFVISEKLLKNKGIIPIIDGLERSRESRPILLITVVKDDAEEILTVESAIETINAKGLTDQINLTMNEIGSVVDDNGRLFNMKLSRPGYEPVAVYLELLNDEKNNTELEPGSPPPIKIAGLAAFRKDKLAGFFNDRETRGYNWAKGNIRRAVLTVESPEKEGQLLTIVATQDYRKCEPIIKDGQSSIQLTVRATGMIQGVMGTTSIEGESDLTHSLKQRFAQVIRNDIEMAIDKAQSLKSDIFGFGNCFYRKKYQDWLDMEDNWEEIFSTLPVDIDVQVEIKRTGMINQSITPR